MIQHLGKGITNIHDVFPWVKPKELVLLEAFLEAIMIDTMEKINNEKRPLLTAGGKDSNDNMFIF